MLLETKDLHVSYGAIRALSGISFTMKQGEIVALIGANGAGKSTTLRTISGLIRPSAGQITFKGMDLLKLAPHTIVSKGISQVPEGRRVFPLMSVRENLEMGAYTRKNRAEIRKSMEEIFERFPRLQERINQAAGTLSGGEQQMLAMGRALMSKPEVLLLDEPSMGLAPMLVQEIFNIIEDINATGTSILLVEQNAHMALSIAHRAYVLETGEIALSGLAKDLARDEQVRKAYLGEG